MEDLVLLNVTEQFSGTQAIFCWLQSTGTLSIKETHCMESDLII